MVEALVRKKDRCKCAAVACSRDGVTLGKMDDCMFCLALDPEMPCPRTPPKPSPVPKKTTTKKAP